MAGLVDSKRLRSFYSSRSVRYGAALLLAAALFLSPFRTGVVLGDSMYPAFRSGEPYVLDRGYYRSHPLSLNDVVVVRHEGETLIKRVAALGGTRLHVLQYPDSGKTDVIQPGNLERLRRLKELPIFQNLYRIRTIDVPPGACFLLGDNRPVSLDSRAFGPVPEAEILGKVVLTPPVDDRTAYSTSATWDHGL